MSEKTLYGVDRALSWADGSAERTLNGGQPTEAAADQPSIEQRLERIQSDLAWIREQLAGNGGQSRSA